MSLVGQSARDGKLKAVIARTLKGRGVDGLENHPLSHIINLKRETLDDLLGTDSVKPIAQRDALLRRIHEHENG